MRNKVVNKKSTRGKDDYFKVLKTIETEGKCPFCRDNFKYHKNEILKKRKNWFITKNSWPYKNSLYHFLIIGLKHKESLSELNENDFRSVRELADWAIKKFKIKGGALTVRFGDVNLSGSTVYHIHFHLISPKQKNNGIAKTVNFPIG